MYPKVKIDLQKLRENVCFVVDKCAAQGIEIVGVVKGLTGIPEVSRAYADGGVKMIASSRLEHLEDAIEAGVSVPMMLIRIPMLSEVRDVIQLSEMSLNSEISVLDALNAEAGRQGKRHQVMLMPDIGDLREGFWGETDLVEAALHVERRLKNLYLAGIAINVGCYGSIEPTAEKLQEAVDLAHAVERAIGRKLDFISGGASSSLMRVWDGDMPEGINHLRIGGEIAMNHTMRITRGYDMRPMHEDVCRLYAEVIQLKEKPMHGTEFDANPVMGKQAVIALGMVDYGREPECLIHLESGIELVDATDDTTIFDVTHMEREIQVGDILEFGVKYATICYLTNSPNVKIELTNIHQYIKVKP